MLYQSSEWAPVSKALEMCEQDGILVINGVFCHGYRFCMERWEYLALAVKTITNATDKLYRLYEQNENGTFRFRFVEEYCYRSQYAQRGRLLALQDWSRAENNPQSSPLSFIDFS